MASNSRAVFLLMLASACPSSPSTDGVAPPVAYGWELRNGTLHDAAVAEFQALDLPTARAWRAAAIADGAVALGVVEDMELISTHVEITPAGTRLGHIRARQLVGGVPVHGSYASFTARGQDARGGAKLVISSHHVYRADGSVTTPTRAQVDAEAIAREAVRAPADAAIIESELVLWPERGSLELVWSVVVDTAPGSRVLVSAVGAPRTRTVVERYDAHGRISGHVVQGGAPGGRGVPALRPLANVYVPRPVASYETPAAITAADGSYELAIEDGRSIHVGLTGRGVWQVLDRSGAVRVFQTVTAGPDASVTFGDPADPLSLATVTTYHELDRLWAFHRERGVEAVARDLVVWVNEVGDCNAYYEPAARRMTFFQPYGTRCNNTAETTIIAHEYGHHLDHAKGGITDHALSEGWGDLVACLFTGAPGVGVDLFPGGPALRSCANDYRYPPTGFDTPHAMGQAWSGFAWDARAALIELGLYEDRWLLASLVSNATDIPTAVRELFVRFDDDGDLSNGSPTWDALLRAAERHNLEWVVVPDHDPPAAVGELAITDIRGTALSLEWIAPGDDGTIGVASAYDIRRSNRPITEESFGDARRVGGSVHELPGGRRRVIVTVAPGEAVHLAVRPIDDAGNVGPVTTANATVPPGRILYATSFEDGSDWRTTGMWHVSTRRASDGTHAMWFGDEVTGTYDTPNTRSAGRTDTPPIAVGSAAKPVVVFDTWFDVETGRDLGWIAMATPRASLLLPLGLSRSDGFETRMYRVPDGESVTVSFLFDTQDIWANQREGWYLDNLRVVDVALPTCRLCGDVDGDGGSVDLDDIARAEACVSSYDPDRCHGCDVDGDFACTRADVEQLRRAQADRTVRLDCTAQGCTLPACGDVDASGSVDVSDLLAIQRCLFSIDKNPCELCDVSGDGACTVSDIVAINAGLFGAPMDCAAQPRRR